MRHIAGHSNIHALHVNLPDFYGLNLVIFSKWKMESSKNICTFPYVANKVIKSKSRREVSPLKKDTIDCMY